MYSFTMEGWCYLATFVLTLIHLTGVNANSTSDNLPTPGTTDQGSLSPSPTSNHLIQSNSDFILHHLPESSISTKGSFYKPSAYFRTERTSSINEYQTSTSGLQSSLYSTALVPTPFNEFPWTFLDIFNQHTGDTLPSLASPDDVSQFATSAKIFTVSTSTSHSFSNDGSPVSISSSSTPSLTINSNVPDFQSNIEETTYFAKYTTVLTSTSSSLSSDALPESVYSSPTPTLVINPNEPNLGLDGLASSASTVSSTTSSSLSSDAPPESVYSSPTPTLTINPDEPNLGLDGLASSASTVSSTTSSSLSSDTPPESVYSSPTHALTINPGEPNLRLDGLVSSAFTVSSTTLSSLSSDTLPESVYSSPTPTLVINPDEPGFGSHVQEALTPAKPTSVSTNTPAFYLFSLFDYILSDYAPDSSSALSTPPFSDDIITSTTSAVDLTKNSVSDLETSPLFSEPFSRTSVHTSALTTDPAEITILNNRSHVSEEQLSIEITSSSVIPAESIVPSDLYDSHLQQTPSVTIPLMEGADNFTSFIGSRDFTEQASKDLGIRSSTSQNFDLYPPVSSTTIPNTFTIQPTPTSAEFLTTTATLLPTTVEDSGSMTDSHQSADNLNSFEFLEQEESTKATLFPSEGSSFIEESSELSEQEKSTIMPAFVPTTTSYFTQEANGMSQQETTTVDTFLTSTDSGFWDGEQLTHKDNQSPSIEPSFNQNPSESRQQLTTMISSTEADVHFKQTTVHAYNMSKVSPMPQATGHFSESHEFQLDSTDTLQGFDTFTLDTNLLTSPHLTETETVSSFSTKPLAMVDGTLFLSDFWAPFSSVSSSSIEWSGYPSLTPSESASSVLTSNSGLVDGISVDPTLNPSNMYILNATHDIVSKFNFTIPGTADIPFATPSPGSTTAFSPQPTQITSTNTVLYSNTVVLEDSYGTSKESIRGIFTSDETFVTPSDYDYIATTTQLESNFNSMQLFETSAQDSVHIDTSVPPIAVSSNTDGSLTDSYFTDSERMTSRLIGILSTSVSDISDSIIDSDIYPSSYFTFTSAIQASSQLFIHGTLSPSESLEFSSEISISNVSSYTQDMHSISYVSELNSSYIESTLVLNTQTYTKNLSSTTHSDLEPTVSYIEPILTTATPPITPPWQLPSEEQFSSMSDLPPWYNTDLSDSLISMKSETETSEMLSFYSSNTGFPILETSHSIQTSQLPSSTFLLPTFHTSYLYSSIFHPSYISSLDGSSLSSFITSPLESNTLLQSLDSSLDHHTSNVVTKSWLLPSFQISSVLSTPVIPELSMSSLVDLSTETTTIETAEIISNTGLYPSLEISSINPSFSDLDSLLSSEMSDTHTRSKLYSSESLATDLFPSSLSFSTIPPWVISPDITHTSYLNTDSLLPTLQTSFETPSTSALSPYHSSVINTSVPDTLDLDTSDFSNQTPLMTSSQDFATFTSMSTESTMLEVSDLESSDSWLSSSLLYPTFTDSNSDLPETTHIQSEAGFSSSVSGLEPSQETFFTNFPLTSSMEIVVPSSSSAEIQPSEHISDSIDATITSSLEPSSSFVHSRHSSQTGMLSVQSSLTEIVADTVTVSYSNMQSISDSFGSSPVESVMASSIYSTPDLMSTLSGISFVQTTLIPTSVESETILPSVETTQDIMSSLTIVQSVQTTPDLTSSEITVPSVETTQDIMSSLTIVQSVQTTPDLTSSEITVPSVETTQDIVSSLTIVQSVQTTPDLTSSETIVPSVETTQDIMSSLTIVQSVQITPDLTSSETIVPSVETTQDIMSSLTIVQSVQITPDLTSSETIVPSVETTQDIVSLLTSSVQTTQHLIPSVITVPSVETTQNLMSSFTIIQSVQTSPDIIASSSETIASSVKTTEDQISTDSMILSVETTLIVPTAETIIPSMETTPDQMSSESETPSTIFPSSIEPTGTTGVDTTTLPPESSTIFPTSSPDVTSPSSSVGTTVSVTVTPTAVSPTLNTSNSFRAAWVVTVIKVARSENTTTGEFEDKMEGRLASAYGKAFIRQEQINNGTYEPLRRRRRRYSQLGDVKLEMIEVKRFDSNVDMVYYMEKSGEVVPADTAVSVLSLLNDQEVALQLGYVVSTKAKAYVVSPEAYTEQPRYWIIGAVLGSIAGAIVILWCTLCIYYRCCRIPPQKDLEEEGEPHLVALKGKDFQASHPEAEYIREMLQKAKSNGTTSNHTRSHDQTPSEDPIYAQVRKPVKRPQPQRAPRQSQSYVEEDGSVMEDTTQYVSDEGSLNTQAKPRRPKTKRKRSGAGSRNIVDVEEGVSGESTQTSIHYMKVPVQEKPLRSSHNGHRSDETDPDLQQKLQLERWKNKQRQRERRRNTSQEMEKPPRRRLHSGETSLHKPSVSSLPSEQTSQVQGFVNGAFSESEPEADRHPQETLDQARKRMHRLLDDAFSLVTPVVQANQQNKISPHLEPPVSQERESRPKPVGRPKPAQRRPSAQDELEEMKREMSVNQSTNPPKPTPRRSTEKRHTPMVIDPGKRLKEANKHTYNPYKAGDETAELFLPQEEEIKPMRAASSPFLGRIPTTSLKDLNPVSYTENGMTTEEPKPIVITTRRDAWADPQYNDSPMSEKYEFIPKDTSTLTTTSKSSNNKTTSKYAALIRDLDTGSLEKKLSPRSLKETNQSDQTIELRPLGSNGRKWTAREGSDEIDVIKDSLAAGVSPEPLIRSIREELMRLSSGSAGKDVSSC